MTREEAIRDIEEIKEIMQCDASFDVKLRMILDVVNSEKPHSFQEIINEKKFLKPCPFCGGTNNVISDEMTLEQARQTVTNLRNGLEKIQSDMLWYRDAFILARRNDLASVVENCLIMVKKHIASQAESKD